MSDDDISQAFAHPLERARASQAAGPVPDRISLRDHIVSVEIGAFAAERGVSQRLAFNVVVEVVAPGGPVADDVDKILSYDRVTEAISAELAARRFDLLETLAEGIAQRILQAPQAVRVFVRIEKLDRGPGALGVEIVRSGKPQAPPSVAHPLPQIRPLLVHLPASCFAEAGLTGFLDLLAHATFPALLSAAQPDCPPPESLTARAAAQISLLAADQAAWQICSADHRLSVAASRTEIDWALAGRHLAVWAPARLILAAANPPEHPADPLSRSLWLAHHLNARAVLLVGDLPPDARLTQAEIPLLHTRLNDTALPKLP